MGLIIRILMVILVLIIIVSNVLFLIITSGTPEECRKNMVSAKYSSESAVDACKDMHASKTTKYIVVGISGIVILICGIVFFVKRD